MPRIVLSKEEKCGEILRVVAKVMPYRDNQYVEKLSQADRVEIVYTLFYAWDGGRNYLGTHAGDNEGFVIGLVPSTRSEGRCGLPGLNYEIYGGRTVKHKDVPLGAQSLAEAGLQQPQALLWAYLATLGEEAIKWFGFERGIEDWTYNDPDTRCPSFGDDYFLWVAESKHAAYFDRDECEQTMLGFKIEVTDVLGLDRLVLGPLGFAEKLIPMDDLLGISAGEKSIVVGGLEECEAGRDPVDLSDRVELWPISMQSIAQNDRDDCGNPTGSGPYACMDGEDEQDRGIHWDSYAKDTRGKPEDIGDAYHVPFLGCPGFDREHAIAIRFDGVPDRSEWIATAIGLDGFNPRIGVDGEPFICDDDTGNAARYAVAGLPAHGDIPPSDRSSQIAFQAVNGGSRTFYVDSADGRDGRFLVIIESPNGGLTITPGDDEDRFVVSPIPETPLDFYVISEQTDPDLILSYPPEPAIVSSTSGMAGLAISTGQTGYQGHATDEYLRIILGGSAGEREFLVGSAGSGTGRYVAMVYAETARGTVPTATPTGTSSPTPTPTGTSSPTPTPTQTNTFIPTPTSTPTSTATNTPTPRPSAPQIEYFRVDSESILEGECARLEWGSVSHATQARVEPDVGGVATPDSANVCPSTTTTYVLTATGAGGTTTASLVVTVGTASPPVPENVWAGRSGDIVQVVDIHWDPSPGATYYVVYADVGTESEFRSQLRQELSGISYEVEDWYMEGCTAEDSYGWIQACNEAGCSPQVEIPWPGMSVSIDF